MQSSFSHSSDPSYLSIRNTINAKVVMIRTSSRVNVRKTMQEMGRIGDFGFSQNGITESSSGERVYTIDDVFGERGTEWWIFLAFYDTRRPGLAPRFMRGNRSQEDSAGTEFWSDGAFQKR